MNRFKMPIAVGMAAAGLLAMAGPAAAACAETTGVIIDGTIVISPNGLDDIPVDFGELSTINPCGLNEDAGITLKVSDDPAEWTTKVVDVFGTTTIQRDLDGVGGDETYIVSLSLLTNPLSPPSQAGLLTDLGGGLYDVSQDIAIQFDVQQVTVNGENDCTPIENGDCTIGLEAQGLFGDYTENSASLPGLDGTVSISGSGTATAGPCNNTILAQIGTATVTITDPLQVTFPAP